MALRHRSNAFKFQIEKKAYGHIKGNTIWQKMHKDDVS
jgi:hypothetical protein